MTRAAALLLAMTACSSNRADDPAPERAAPGVVAHRGASRDAPENSLAAIRIAFEQGADAVEIDVWPTRDGRIIVFHDETTERFGGPDVPVYEQDFAALRELDLGDGERIPALEDVLAAVPERRALFIEIKSGPATVPAIAGVIEAHDPRPRGAKLGFQGFSLEVMRAVRARFPDAPAYWLRGAERDRDTKRILPIDPAIVERAAAAKLTGVAVDHRGLSPELARAARAAGQELYLWTMDDPDEIRRARDAGAVWIETNLPAMAVGALRDTPARKPR